MFAALLLGLALASAQDAGPTQEEAPLPPDPDAPVDEVTVFADDTITNLRRLLRNVDQQFYTRYNELNSNDDFDMVCKRETRIGSQIPRQVCRSKLHRARISEAAEDVLDQDIGLGEDSTAWTRRHYRKVREDVRRVLGEDESLREIVRDRKRILEEIERRKASNEN